MAGGSSVTVVRDIQTLFDHGTASGLSDRQLLDRFVNRHDAEASFEVLVLRHGPMVLRVCQNLLDDPNDAHDAFQATFLVLVRRCRSMKGIESVGGWLYGVACRVAARARVDSARRRAVEDRAALRIVEATDASQEIDVEQAEFGPVIQEELRRLPERYRTVVVLCYWESLTHEQAAAQLGCPLGTVRSRLARARNLLRRRLSRRGMAPMAAVLAGGLDRVPTSASVVVRNLAPVPRALVQSTIHAASRIAAGQATAQIVSGFSASLVHKVLWSMTMVKVKMAIVGVLLGGLIVSGGWFGVLKAPLARAQVKAAQKSAQPGKKRKTADSERVYSLVQGQATIIMLVPDGSTVKKGQVVCTLDWAMLRDQLVNQQITTKSAAADYENTKLTREVAEIAVVEYAEGRFKNQIAETEGNIKIAEAELAFAEDTLVAVRPNDAAPKLETKRATLAVLRARFALEKAQGRKKVLLDYTKHKKFKELESAVEKARSEELAKKAIWALEDSKEKMLERQIARCTIVAPRDGTLVYAPPNNNRVVQKRDGTLVNMPAVIEEGATVRERQILFEIVPVPETP
jgi:HlyD family secretion protein